MKKRNVITDKRSRQYILPERILWSSGIVKNAEKLLTKGSRQPTIWGDEGTLLSPDASILVDFGSELHGGILIVSGRSMDDKVLNIRVRFGESVSEAMGLPNNDHAMNDTVVDIASMSTTEIGNTGYRFVRIDNISGHDNIEIREINAVFVFHDYPYRGEFSCDDKLLEKIWYTGAYTTHLCLQEFVWDGIKRDRFVWMGDMHPEIMAASAVFGHLDIFEKSMDLVRNEAVLPSFINGTVSYSLWWMIGQHAWYQLHGNYDYLRQQQEYLESLIYELLKHIDDSGAEKLNQTWRILDWATQGDEVSVHAGHQALLIITLKAGLQLCQILKKEACACKCIKGLNKLYNYIPPKCESKSANALQALAEMKAFEEVNAEVLSINPCKALSPYHGYYVLQARARANDYTGCVDLLRKYWGGMLALGATTFWEHFDIDWMNNANRIDELPSDCKKDVHKECGAECYKGLRHSFCHGWSSGPTAWISEHILGINIIEPGGKTINLNPHLPGVKWAHGSYPTPFGNIEVEHKKASNGEIVTKYNAPKSVRILSEA